MTKKRFINDINNGKLIDTKGELSTINYSNSVDFYELWEFLNKLNDENEQLKTENNKLHQKIFEMRTNIALERTEISGQTYTGKKTSKEYLTATEFLNEIEKW